MRKSKFTDSQIMDAVKLVEAGFGVPDICRELGISTATFYICIRVACQAFRISKSCKKTAMARASEKA